MSPDLYRRQKNNFICIVCEKRVSTVNAVALPDKLIPKSVTRLGDACTACAIRLLIAHIFGLSKK